MINRKNKEILTYEKNAKKNIKITNFKNKQILTIKKKKH